MEEKKLNAIMDVINSTSMKECEIISSNGKIKIVRLNTEPLKSEEEKAAVVKKRVDTAVEKPADKSTEKQSNKLDILSKWVGYFYRSKEKNGKPIVKLREHVKEGQQIGIVITLNIVHDVMSQVSGKLTEILVEDGQPVEYDQPLIRLREGADTEEEENNA